jgi:hypothetical protein
MTVFQKAVQGLSVGSMFWLAMVSGILARIHRMLDAGC